MELIDKAAVVAKIEELDNFWHLSKSASGQAFVESLLSFLDTLETKEIDLKKESELIANGIMIGVQGNKYHTCMYNPERCDFNHSHLWLAARKGIEFGLNAQKGE